MKNVAVTSFNVWIKKHYPEDYKAHGELSKSQVKKLVKESTKNNTTIHKYYIENRTKSNSFLQQVKEISS